MSIPTDKNGNFINLSNNKIEYNNLDNNKSYKYEIKQIDKKIDSLKEKLKSSISSHFTQHFQKDIEKLYKKKNKLLSLDKDTKITNLNKNIEDLDKKIIGLKEKNLLMDKDIEKLVKSNEELDKKIKELKNKNTEKNIEPISYIKGKIKTKELIPTKKEKLGKGTSGIVHVAKNDSSKIVKKSNINIEKEYKIGKKLNHINLMKTDQLYIKKYQNGKKTKYKLVAEKITGRQLSNIYNLNKKNSKDVTLKLIEQAKDLCCNYLFDENIVWKDVNAENLFIEKESNKLKIIDFGHWEEIEEPNEKTFSLLTGAMEICGWIVKTSTLRERGKQQELENKILFFESMMRDRPYQVMSISTSFKNPTSWEASLIEEIKKTTNNQERKKLLADYFDHVYKTYEKIASELNLK